MLHPSLTRLCLPRSRLLQHFVWLSRCFVLHVHRVRTASLFMRAFVAGLPFLVTVSGRCFICFISSSALPNLPFLRRLHQDFSSVALASPSLFYFFLVPRFMTTAATPNHALQRTAPCVTAPASAAAFPPAMQVPRRTPLSLSLGSLGVARALPKTTHETIQTQIPT